jgi:hypothetical protein
MQECRGVGDETINYNAMASIINSSFLKAPNHVPSHRGPQFRENSRKQFLKRRK